MKITVGMGNIDDYEDLCKAGADEVFCGIVPLEYSKKYGNVTPLNRREVMYVNVQAGSYSELAILRDMKASLKVPVAITLNSLAYPVESYRYIRECIYKCLELGFDTFIIASVGFLKYLHEDGIIKRIKVHLSGEIGEINTPLLQEMSQYNLERVIFHRKVTIDDMRSIITNFPDLSFEAFALNEMCHFNGGYCNSVHCDELAHMCRVPYRMSDGSSICTSSDYEGIGESGCGLCALYKLKLAHMDYLKVVSRGNYSEATIRDVKAVRRALTILDECRDEEQYISRMKRELFSAGCSKRCYY